MIPRMQPSTYNTRLVHITNRFCQDISFYCSVEKVFYTIGAGDTIVLNSPTPPTTPPNNTILLNCPQIPVALTQDDFTNNHMLIRADTLNININENVETLVQWYIWRNYADVCASKTGYDSCNPPILGKSVIGKLKCLIIQATGDILLSNYYMAQ